MTHVSSDGSTSGGPTRSGSSSFRERYNKIAQDWLDRANNAPNEVARRIALMHHRAAIARRDGNGALADKLKRKAQALSEFVNFSLPIFDELNRQENEQLREEFRREASMATSRAIRGASRAALEATSARGLTGGVASSIEAQAEQNLLFQQAQAETNFSRALSLITKNNRDATIAKQFDMFRQVELMSKNVEFQKELLSFQQKLADDSFFKKLVLGVVQTGAQVVATKKLGTSVAGAIAAGG